MATGHIQEKMIRAAFFDIDGTLLSFNTHQVSPGTVRAFDRMHRAGIHTFLSTGRPKCIVPPMPIDFEAYITMNGALVFTPDTILVSNPIAQKDLENWVDYAKEQSLCTMVFTDKEMYVSQLNQVAMKLRDQLEFPMPKVVSPDELCTLQAYQIIAIMPSDHDSQVATLMPQSRLPRWHPAFTDIVADGNNKAIGMEAICQHFGIRQEETLAFGDGANDIEMLQWAAIGVAMGNADPIVKEHADRVTTDVDHEGIETMINTLLS